MHVDTLVYNRNTITNANRTELSELAIKRCDKAVDGKKEFRSSTCSHKIKLHGVLPIKIASSVDTC